METVLDSKPMHPVDPERRLRCDYKQSKSITRDDRSMLLTPLQRFIKEVQLARDTCTPTRIGLEKYAVELENRGRVGEE